MQNNSAKTILCLDAGGTNFVFSAYKGSKQIGEKVTFPTNGHNIDKCLNSIFEGFSLVKENGGDNPSAISFAFPGPADYKQGIIGDLYNLPCFRGGVPLAAILEEKFNIPVFINNDGDLYTYGEALSGSLVDINNALEKNNNPKRYKNLVGLTLGTGFGAGIFNNGNILFGDNMSAAEIWITSNRVNTNFNSEEGVSIRALKRFYSEHAGINFDSTPEPSEIYKIGIGKQPGNKNAAINAFKTLGRFLGDAIANMITLNDSLVVIGGGIAGAKDLIVPGIMSELNNCFTKPDGAENPRLTHNVYNLNDTNQLNEFLKDESKEIKVPNSNKKLFYTSKPKTGFIFSKYNTSDMINIGAYHFALQRI